jgi:hypothetical protein
MVTIYRARLWIGQDVLTDRHHPVPKRLPAETRCLAANHCAIQMPAEMANFRFLQSLRQALDLPGLNK